MLVCGKGTDSGGEGMIIKYSNINAFARHEPGLVSIVIVPLRAWLRRLNFRRRFPNPHAIMSEGSCRSPVYTHSVCGEDVHDAAIVHSQVCHWTRVVPIEEHSLIAKSDGSRGAAFHV